MMRFSKLLVLLLILSLPGMAKIKVVQKSAKKQPVWVNTSEKDYIITSAISGDIERAKNECLDNIRKYIIDAVAQNVKSTSETNINQESVSSGIVNFLDKYSYTSQTQSANVPYLTGISASKVEDSYWEKREDKDTKTVSYLYCMKYPFPSLELKKLVHEFQKRDSEMNDKFKALEKGFENISTVEQIDKSISDINPLISYFFDDIRKEAARTLQRNYQQLYKQISFREISNELGNYAFSLTLRGKDITTSQRPVLKSETLTQLRMEQADSALKVFYNYATCDPSEENSATVSFRIGGSPLVKSFFIDVNQEKVQLFPTKEMYLTATKQDSILKNIIVRMNIDSRSAKKIKIFSITLDVPGLNKPVIINDLDIKIDAVGIQTVQVTYSGEVKLITGQDNRSNLLKGHLEIVNHKGANSRIDFSLPFKANW